MQNVAWPPVADGENPEFGAGIEAIRKSDRMKLKFRKIQ